MTRTPLRVRRGTFDFSSRTDELGMCVLLKDIAVVSNELLKYPTY